MSRLNWWVYSIEKTINKIFWVCLFLIGVDGEERGNVVGGRVGQCLGRLNCDRTCVEQG